MIWYVTEKTYEGEIQAIRKVDSTSIDIDGDISYFSKFLGDVWEHPKMEYDAYIDTPYYEDNIFKGPTGHKNLVREILR